MIEIEKLVFSYKQNTGSIGLLNIDKLKIEKNRKTMLYGSSGCGKTTLLNLIAGILSTDSGKIIVNSEDVSSKSEDERRLFRLNNIGYVLQDFSLIPHLKLNDNVKLPFFINPEFQWKSEFQKQFDKLIESLGLEKLINKFPTELSIGEKQRVCLCRALITKPKLILADEPTANLDEDNRDTVLKILDEYVKDNGATLLMVSHDMSIRDHFDHTIAFKEVNNA